MYQRKGEKPTKKFPNFKLLLPANITARTIIEELLEDVGLKYIPSEIVSAYLVHRNGEIGQGNDMRSFLTATLPEMTLTELSEWKVVPVPLTLAEIEKMIGHQIQIIEEEK